MNTNTIISLSSAIIAGAAAFFTHKQAKLALKQYTFSYIEMENNDIELQRAREWLLDIRNEIEYITSFYSTKEFLRFKGCQKEFDENKFPDQDLADEFIMGRRYIEKIISMRIVSSEAIINSLLDEQTYWLVRHIDFKKDYVKLEKFILETYLFHNSHSSYERKAFRTVLKKWELDPPISKGISSFFKKEEWEKYQEPLKEDNNRQ